VVGADTPVFVNKGRHPECVEAWPECHTFGYDPRCCRFPKSCSCEIIEKVEVPTVDGEVMSLQCGFMESHEHHNWFSGAKQCYCMGID